MTGIDTTDGLRLEAEWASPEDPLNALVLCHPHPLHGGTMNAPLMRSLTRVLVKSGFAVLRFNFRGVGSSQGSLSGGSAAVADVAAAVAAARRSHPNLPLGLAGWSFGATTSLRWQSEHQSTLPWAGVAPAVRPYPGVEPPDPSRLEPARRLIIIGDRDQFASVEEIETYGAALDARVEVIAGSDHFFIFREKRLGELLSAHFAPSSSPARETTDG